MKRENVAQELRCTAKALGVRKCTHMITPKVKCLQPGRKQAVKGACGACCIKSRLAAG